MGPSITYSNISFIQPYLSKRRVMLVLREFFFCQLCRESEKKNACSITFVYIN